jgi:hypothetical protein
MSMAHDASAAAACALAAAASPPSSDAAAEILPGRACKTSVTSPAWSTTVHSVAHPRKAFSNCRFRMVSRAACVRQARVRNGANPCAARLCGQMAIIYALFEWTSIRPNKIFDEDA